MPSIASPALSPTLAMRPRAETAHLAASAEALGRVLQQSAPGPWRIAPAVAGALTAVRAARFKPCTEGGVPQPVCVLAPIVFESEK